MLIRQADAGPAVSLASLAPHRGLPVARGLSLRAPHREAGASEAWPQHTAAPGMALCAFPRRTSPAAHISEQTPSPPRLVNCPLRYQDPSHLVVHSVHPHSTPGPVAWPLGRVLPGGPLGRRLTPLGPLSHCIHREAARLALCGRFSSLGPVFSTAHVPSERMKIDFLI